MEVGIEVEGPQAWLLGNDLTHDCDGAVCDSAPSQAQRAPTGSVCTYVTSGPNHGSGGAFDCPQNLIQVSTPLW
jgi:hypothetical protein